MEKIKEVDWRGLYKSATQKVKKYTLNLTDLEIKVEDATNEETWGPHGSTMNEIADASFDPESYRQIMGVLARRLQEKEERWRCCYKALLLLEHLIKHGPGKIVGDVQSSAGVLDRLQHFDYKDPNMKDHGVNVRHRAKEILQLVNSPDRLRAERDKAKANREKYRGVSADQMRSGGATGSTSLARSTSDRFTSSTVGSLGGSGGGGALGGLGGGSLASRRTDSYDETEHDSHYISKRTSASEAPAGGAAGASEDALAATRARIEKLKLAEERPSAGADGAEPGKKKLTDVRVNPKIAASLGLKLPAPAPARPAAGAPTAAASAGEIDLLGGLEDPAPAPAAHAAAAASFDPFAAPAAPPAAPQQQQRQQSWDAFGGASASSAAPAAPAGSPLDLLGGFGAGPAARATPAAPMFQPQPQPAVAAAPADPFAAFGAPPAAAPPPLAAARPAAPAAASLASVAAGVPAALPEDMFADLTGIGRAPAPMGYSPPHRPAAPVGGSGFGFGAPPAAQPMGASLPSPGGGFGDFSGGFVSAAPPALPAGGFGGGVGMGGLSVPAAFTSSPPRQQQPQQQQQFDQRQPGSRNASVDFGSFSYSAPPAGGASAADPFADLF